MKAFGRRLEKYFEDMKVKVRFLIMVNDWKTINFYF